MNRHFKKFMPKLLLLAPILFSLLSCSKDADLLSDYVINKKDDISGVYSLLVNDTYFSDMKSSILLDVLNNDTFENFNTVTVVATTAPELGTVVINENNTLTYTPPTPPVVNETEAATVEIEPTPQETQEEIVDTFVYTTEETSIAGTVTTAEATVTVKMITVNNDVEYWKLKFDAEWVDKDNQVDSFDALSKAKSGNVNQEYYYLGYYVDGLIKIWQATGDNKYLDRALNLINLTVSDAVSVGNGYLGWPNNDNDGHALWDSFYWRYVATLLRIMHQSPQLRASGNYEQQYQQLLNFTEKNIWERYEAQGLNNFYRINTHMASHWARIGMELFIITGKTKYKTVFDNISFAQMLNRPSNLRNQLKPNSIVPSAYTWSQNWDSYRIQDTSHAGAIISFIITAYENDMYWNKADIDALTSTVNDVIWKPEYGIQFMKNVDGTGGYDLPGRLNEWLNLGRFNQSLQNRIKNYYTGMNLTFYGIQPLGIAALNARILADGKPIYPEQY